MNRAMKYMLLAAAMLLAATSQAELFRVGPNDVPSPPGHGYPAWYQDTNGLALDLCIPQSLNQLDACLATPMPGDPLPTLPYVFPSNWPDEFFWFGADAMIDIGGGSTAILTQAVEAAFGVGPAAAGDQVTFARIRIRFVPPVDGTYTVTYPYGEDVFPNLVAGERLFHTSDIGLGAPGDFAGALTGAVGPYLTAVTNNGAAEPYFMIDGDSFLADPLGVTQVTGSPFSTNYFQICVDNPAGFDGAGLVPCLSTADFALIGKVHTAPIDSPLGVDRATYSTHAGMPTAHIDVFASAEPGPGAAMPDLSVGIAGGASAHMVGPRNPGGLFYSQSIVALNAIPSTVTVINSADSPASSVVSNLVDAITISEASYDATTNDLVIRAMSSDMVSPPTLAAIGIPGSASGSDVLIAGSYIVNLPLGTVPPETVTVVSTAGGSATSTVIMPTHGIPFPVGAPLAVDDHVSTNEGIAATFAILANDGAEAVAGTVGLLAIPTSGTATVNLDGTVGYVPNAGYFGADSFTYTVSSAALLSSNIATAFIDVVQFNDPPIANDDTASSPTGVPSIIINVTANDTDADGVAPAPGGLDPASVAIVSVSAGSTADSTNGDGTVNFAVGTCTAACGFSYTVSDIGTPIITSNVATVTISTAGNIMPSANPDAASVIVDRSVAINVAANDTDPDGTVNPTSVAIVAGSITGGSVFNNGDGTVTFAAPATAGTYTFSYTIADNLNGVSGAGLVTVTVNPAPDTLGITRSECRAGKNEWRVDGTSSVLAPHSLTIYAGATVGGTVIQANVAVDNLGSWRMAKSPGGACTSIISIESSLGGKLENVFIPVN